MTANNIIAAIQETANHSIDEHVIQALRGIVARASRYEAQELKDDHAFQAGIREGWRESQEMEDRNQAFAFCIGSLKEEDLSPKQLRMAEEMKADAEKRSLKK